MVRLIFSGEVVRDATAERHGVTPKSSLPDAEQKN
jgi:hypothetical protein